MLERIRQFGELLLTKLLRRSPAGTPASPEPVPEPAPDPVVEVSAAPAEASEPAPAPVVEVPAAPTEAPEPVSVPAVDAPPRKVFVDCGANTCTVLRSFIAQYPDREFFAFEAQPELKTEGEKLINERPDIDLKFFSKAVWTKNETLDFFLATQWGHNYKGGSTLMAGHTENGAVVDYQAPVQVPAFDFSEWLRDNFSESDHVIVKMDIEGAEYDVLEKVIADGNIGLIDELIIELHYGMNTSITEERHTALVEVLQRSLKLDIWT